GLTGQRQVGAIERRRPRVLAERHAEHPVRVVDQEAAVAADLVAVEDVLGPVVAGHGRTADHPVLQQRAGAERHEQPPGGGRGGGNRTGSLPGSTSPTSTSSANTAITVPRSSLTPAEESQISATIAAPPPSAGAAASAAAGLSRTPSGSSGTSASPGPSASARS